tara:strand:- start:269 stop:1678 length:1410 start_codon:yes stop_codon:yes gene_type:complete
MNKKKCDLLIRNACIVSMNSSRTIFSPGAVAISKSRIVDVGSDNKITQRIEAKEIIDAKGGIVHPGFIDAHNHIVHTSCRGVFKNVHDIKNSQINFADWKAGVTEEDETDATIMACLEMLRGGFTMFIEPGSLFSTKAAAKAVERVGIRAMFAGLYLWDRPEPFVAIPSLKSHSLMARAPIDSKRSLDSIDAELYRNSDPNALVKGYVFVYGEGTASPTLLQAAKNCANQHKVPMHLHAGYVPKGSDIYKATTGKTQLEHLNELKVLDNDTVLVHANVLDEQEEEILRYNNTQVVWCPSAFFSLGMGVNFSFQMIKRHRDGITISLGADGTFDTPPSECMRTAHLQSQIYGDSIDPHILLEMQTINAAKAAGMDHDIGSIEIGKKADIVVRDYRVAESFADNNPIHVLALNLGQGSVHTVLVNGHKVFENGFSTIIDEHEAHRRLSLSIRQRAIRLSHGLDLVWPIISN